MSPKDIDSLQGHRSSPDASFLSSYPDILTIGEAAEILRTSPEAMETLIQSRTIPCLYLDDHILIPKESFRRFLENSLQVYYTDPVKPEDSSHTQPESMYLENQTAKSDYTPSWKGASQMAAKSKINQPVIINGEKRWITANSMQEFTDKVLKLAGTAQAPGKHLFSDYAWNWFETYSAPNIETVTATTYRRQLRLYLVPAFDGLAVEDITTDDIQRLFNSMNGAKATKDKARMVLNQILDAAVEDKLISQNPAKSRRIKITGKASKATPPYTVEQMRYLVQHIGDLQNPLDRAYLALQALHPLRLEEVLGLQPEDIDTEHMTIHIRRAVTHPTRNQPEIKDTKTDSSHRIIGLSALAFPHLQELHPGGKFLFGGEKPLSYTQVRRMCQRIQRETGFTESITPIRFRTTVLTDLYDQTKDIKLAQAAAGHTTSAMTLKYYVKGRETSSQATAAVDKLYSA